MVVGGMTKIKTRDDQPRCGMTGFKTRDDQLASTVTIWQSA